MKTNSLYKISSNLGTYLTLLISLTGCSTGIMRPINGANGALRQIAESHREPTLGIFWLATLANHQGKEKIELFDLRSRSKVALPGLNRPDAQPISISVSGNGERIALIRLRNDKTELLIYRRNVGTLQKLEISPAGIPRSVSLDGKGGKMAVQVSRNGRWDIDLIRIQG